MIVGGHFAIEMGRQRVTTDNDRQRQATTVNARQRQATTSNDRQRHSTSNDDSVRQRQATSKRTDAPRKARGSGRAYSKQRDDN